MNEQKHNTVYLKNYTPPPYLVTSVDLRFELDESRTRVRNLMRLARNRHPGGSDRPLELNGEHLEIRSICLERTPLEPSDYEYDGAVLRIDAGHLPDSFEIEIETLINPSANTALEGLYLSGGNYCTQCEAEGFRRITCFPDRPDVMAHFTTTIIADQKRCPVLLSNGNLVESGNLDNGRHYAVWHDPFRKPCYLFALVAGNLVRIGDTYTTLSGRRVDLHIYVEPRNRDKCAHAMASLRKAMKWDEDTFGLEYDLDVYMIVAVDDFNMGAMENKGLNVFNSKYVLAGPETATDADYEGIEGVIGHEYFHNWTGNRVTCRDWFQLSLKEGLTVFRDQEFTSDMTSRPVKRIHDVLVMRNYQFREDAGPMAHPVRPESYQAINNFYTLTVYDKGAEVIRMLHTLLGPDGFRKGLALYFTRHDGQAVTCDDFVAAMRDANNRTLAGFTLWYSQAGTPLLKVTEEYDQEERRYTLTIRQSCPPTPGQDRKEPMLMPVAVGLLDSHGRDMVSDGGHSTFASGRVLQLRHAQQSFVFEGVSERPVLSFLRNFSAPVKVELERSDAQLGFIMAHDSDPFNRWDAGQQLALKYILEQIGVYRDGGSLAVPEIFVTAFRRVLLDREADPPFIALALNLPMENWIGTQMETIDPEAVFAVLQFFRHELATALEREFLDVYMSNTTGRPYRYDSVEAGRRSLKNRCLSYLLTPGPTGGVPDDLLELALSQYRQSDNMTDTMAALKAVVNCDAEKGRELLDDFYARWKEEPLVVDKWLTLQALCTLPGTLERVKALTNHPAFTLHNPNKVRSLIGAFCSANHVGFHDISGAGYIFLADYVIRLDRMNPQIAARLLTPLTTWQRYSPRRRELMRAELDRILSAPDLSRDVAEVAEKSLL